MTANRLASLCVVAWIMASSSAPLRADPLSPGFTYQGQLKQNGQPVPGPVNLTFFLYDSAAGGTQIGMAVFVTIPTLENGLFTVLLNSENEFGSNAFSGNRRWLAVSVNGAPPLSPRQELTVTPNAQFALSAPWSGIIGVPPIALLNSAQTFTAMQTFSAGATTSAFKLTAGPQPGYVMTSDATGNGTWQAVPPAPIPTPLTLTAAVSNSHVIKGQNTQTEPGSSGSIGVVGDATGLGRGVVGSATDGQGVHGISQSSFGVWGQSFGTTSSAIGVAGVAFGQSGGTYGGYFESSNNPSGTGLYGRATANGTAAKFEAFGPSSTGVFISVTAGAAGLQVASGTKSAVVRTADGARALYCEEATEVWFAEYGGGQLKDGRAALAIDPVFAETVSVDEAYRVFVQPEGECEGVYVANKTATKFEVVELRGGRSNAPFSYRLVAKRRGYEKTRMERAPHADDDPNLFPERRAEWEKRNLFPTMATPSASESGASR